MFPPPYNKSCILVKLRVRRDHWPIKDNLNCDIPSVTDMPQFKRCLKQGKWMEGRWDTVFKRGFLPLWLQLLNHWCPLGDAVVHSFRPGKETLKVLEATDAPFKDKRLQSFTIGGSEAYYLSASWPIRNISLGVSLFRKWIEKLSVWIKSDCAHTWRPLVWDSLCRGDLKHWPEKADSGFGRNTR